MSERVSQPQSSRAQLDAALRVLFLSVKRTSNGIVLTASHPPRKGPSGLDKETRFQLPET